MLYEAVVMVVRVASNSMVNVQDSIIHIIIYKKGRLHKSNFVGRYQAYRTILEHTLRLAIVRPSKFHNDIPSRE